MHTHTCVLTQKHRHLHSLPPSTKLVQRNIFRSVCQEFCPQRWACMAGGGGGACVVGCMRGRGQRGGGRAWHMVNKRAVRILLECILVYLHRFTNTNTHTDYINMGVHTSVLRNTHGIHTHVGLLTQKHRN